MNWGLSGLIRLSIAFCLIENYTAPETSFHAKADIKSPVSIRTAKSLKLGLKGWNFPSASLSSNSLQWNWFGLSNSLHFSAFTLSLSLSLSISLSLPAGPTLTASQLPFKSNSDLIFPMPLFMNHGLGFQDPTQLHLSKSKSDFPSYLSLINWTFLKCSSFSLLYSLFSDFKISLFYFETNKSLYSLTLSLSDSAS